MTTPRLAAALVVLVAAGCHRHATVPPADPMLEALRAQDQAAGLTYAEGEGKQLFGHYCATCHGEGGKGDGENASNLNPPVPDLTASKSDAALVRRVVAEGSAAVGRSPLSPPWGHNLNAQEIDDLVLYCRRLAQAKPQSSDATRP